MWWCSSARSRGCSEAPGEASQAGTSAGFALAFNIEANRSLSITLDEVCLALAKASVEGPAGVAGRSPAQAAPSSFQAALVHPCICANQVGDTRDAQSFLDAMR